MRKLVGLAMLLLVGFCAVTFLDASKSDSDRKETFERAMPVDEKAFVNTVADYGGSKFINASALQIVPMRRARAAALCSTLKGGVVKGWAGRVDEISATNQGDAILRVYLYGPGVVDLQNWNTKTNAVSDKMPISQNSGSFAAVSALKQYDLIRFDGEFQPHGSDCFRTNGSRSADADGNIAQTMMSPVFIFRFTRIKPLD